MPPLGRERIGVTNPPSLTEVSRMHFHVSGFFHFTKGKYECTDRGVDGSAFENSPTHHCYRQTKGSQGLGKPSKGDARLVASTPVGYRRLPLEPMAPLV